VAGHVLVVIAAGIVAPADYPIDVGVIGEQAQDTQPLAAAA